jgi:nucleotide-binding universal stress UspA family protein
MRDASGTAVIGYDGSEEAAAAIQQVGSLLGARPAVVVHVWDSLAGLLLHTDVDGLTGPMRQAAEEVDLEDRQDSERIAEEGAGLAREAGFDAEARPLQGKPKAWPVLLAAADAVDAAVLVIGSRGLGSVKSALFGSVASGLLHHADRPVLVVPPCDDVSPAGPVLVGYDGSAAAGAAIAAAGRLLAPREAVIETVWIPYTSVAAGGVVGAPVAVASRATQELDSIAGTRAEQTAREGARMAADAGLEARAEAIQTTGPVWSTLRDSAEVHGAPAIVVGSRGRGSMSSAVLGSTSAALVHHARLPMLVVPPSTNSGS